MRRCWPLLVLAVGLFPSARLAWQFRDMPHLGQYHDDTVYWVTAKSLAQGTGYRILSLPGQPYQTKYPPLYPALLSLVWRWFPSFPDNLRPAMLLAWIMLPLYILTGRLVLRDLGLSPRSAWLLAGALALSPATVLLSATLMTDLLFSVILFGSLHLLVRAGEVESSWRPAALAGLLAGLGYLTRTAGLPLLLTGPLWLLWRGRRRAAVAFAMAMLPAVAGWTLWVRAHQTPSTDSVSLYYLDYIGFQAANLTWSTLPAVVSKNLAFLVASISQAVTSEVGDTVIGDLYWRMFAFAALAGVLRMWRSAASTAYHWFAAALIALVVVWAWPPEPRSVVPLLPLLAAGLCREIGHVLSLLRASAQRADRATRAIRVALCALLIGSACLWAYADGRTILGFLPRAFAQHREVRQSNQAAYAWISASLPSDARFIAYDDVILYLYTGRSACSIRVPTRLYYEDRLNEYVQPYADLDAFARAYRLSHALVTRSDFFRGEVPESRRGEIRRSIEERFAARRVYQAPAAAILDLREPLPALSRSGAGPGLPEQQTELPKP